MRDETSSEPVLPVTPTNEGREPKINNFGYNLAFDQLWAVGLGIAVSIAIALMWVVGLLPGPWYVKIIVVVIPAIGGHIYTKMWIEDALPHAQRDTMARVFAWRLDFERPRWKRFPYIPSITADLTMAGEPELNDGGGHPLHRLRAMRHQHEGRK